jgi:hypothetical protein
VRPPGQPHDPETHDFPEGQLVVHEPQCAASLRVSMQTPLHSLQSGGHAHDPEMHVRPPPHALEHAPQCEGSVVRFTHPAAPQFVRPLGHVPPSPGATYVSTGASVLVSPPPCVTSERAS